MSLFSLLKLGLIGVFPITGIIYPAVNSLSVDKDVNKVIELKSLQAFKEHCWVSIVGGRKGESSETNRKLLVCPVRNGSTSASFYFYDKNSWDSNKLPREVVSLNKYHLRDSFGEDIMLTLVDNSGISEDEKIISVSNLTWQFLYGKELKKVCSVEWQESDKRLKCEHHSVSEQLNKFLHN